MQNIDNFNAQLAYSIALHKAVYDRPCAGVHAVFVEVKQFTSKTEHYKALSLFLSLFLVKYFCFKPVFGACLYAVFHSGSLHLYKQTQKKVHLVLIVPFSVSACMCVVIQNGKLHTNKHQKQVSY